MISCIRISNREDCPCGSGKQYMSCCKGRLGKRIESQKPPEVLIMERMRKSMIKCCMHPDTSKCNHTIKAAHALQNNKIISLLAGSDRHVYVLDAKKQPMLVQVAPQELIPVVNIARVSANDATTETCFCDYHDNVAFACIEKGAPAFDETRDNMKFTYAYKAFVFEYYKHMNCCQIFRNCFKEAPDAFQNPTMISTYRMLQQKTQELLPIKQHFDSQILSGTYSGITTCAVKIPFQIKFANYAYIAPNFDMNGVKIAHTVRGQMHRIAITIFPEETHSWLLMSCLDSEKTIYENLFNQAKTASIDKLKYYLSMTLPLYSENIVLSPSLWNSWDEDTQTAFTVIINTPNSMAAKLDKTIMFGLQNLAQDKTGKAYKNDIKLNLFK